MPLQQNEHWPNWTHIVPTENDTGTYATLFFSPKSSIYEIITFSKNKFQTRDSLKFRI